MFDFIGDVHGCVDELRTLLGKLGYVYQPHFMDGGQTYVYDALGPNAGKRQAVFVGDLNDRGPDSASVLSDVMGMHRAGSALVVLGNHDDKLARWLKGNKVKPSHGLEKTIEELASWSQEQRNELRDWLLSLPYQMFLDNGRVLVAHAGLPANMHGVDNGRVRSHALYGDVSGGDFDAHGMPIRKDWAQTYSHTRIVVHGHVPVKEVRTVNNVWDIDTGCCFGNKLTALRYPEMELVQVDALKNYQPFHPFGAKPGDVVESTPE